ncbi:MAG: adenosine deaminase [Anaerolineales bacterium]|uniref:adenosine deaminase n=1 Tax=Candidatus Villigracilis vicinus TaxID=3140679 RepID=UPI003135449D|nr:adenosine deaminase [Anaerolineales bacterium]MBK9781250.1 adenosine deaminase [Anaerolineales bacterium]
MADETLTLPLNKYIALPKVELHRHLEGSLRLSTMLDIARKHGVTVPVSMLNLSGLVQVQDRDPLTFSNFLEKFKTLRLFYRSPDVIHRVTREAVEDAARDNVRYMELRFTPVALSRAEGFPLHDVMDWVITSAQEAAKEYKIKVGLIASVNRHESPELAEQVAWLAVEHMKNGMVGLDLAGNEAEFKSHPFHNIFKEAKQSGLHITIHAGEWGPSENVRDAIENLGAERIGHGVRVLEDKEVTALALEHNTVFEVCVTSNFQSGVVKQLEDHPLPRMFEKGLKVTVNTDDPSVSRITLSNEFQTAHEKLNISLDVLKKSVLLGAESSFLPEVQKAELLQKLRKELDR